jgi:hypothetical protein
MGKHVRGAFNPKKEVSVLARIEDDKGSVDQVYQICKSRSRGRWKKGQGLPEVRSEWVETKELR